MFCDRNVGSGKAVDKSQEILTKRWFRGVRLQILLEIFVVIIFSILEKHLTEAEFTAKI